MPLASQSPTDLIQIAICLETGLEPEANFWTGAVHFYDMPVNTSK